jgi:predicted nucleic acid-binding protein
MESKYLDEIADGEQVFVDANILIYHLLEDSIFGQSCYDFLNRVERGEIAGITSPVALAEALFTYIRLWVITKKQIQPKKVLQYLKKHREVLEEIDLEKVERLFELLTILPVDRSVITQARRSIPAEKLLPNDAITHALLQIHQLHLIATNDEDFDEISGFTVFKPRAIKSPATPDEEPNEL